MHTLRYGFLDESPALPDPDLYFLIALVVVEEPQMPSLRRLPKRVRQRVLKKKLRQVPELKFYHSNEQVRQRMLERIARSDLHAALLIVDKEGRQVEDSPLNYGMIVGTALAAYLTEIHPRLQVTVDQKYTSPRERERFDRVVQRIVTTFAPESDLTRIEHVQSQGESLVQLADFVAGAAHQKYNRGEGHYWEIIRDRIVLEQMVSWPELKAEAVRLLEE